MRGQGQPLQLQLRLKVSTQTEGSERGPSQIVIKSFLLPSGEMGKMAHRLKISLFLWLLLGICEAGRQMSKLSNKKLCADSECSRK